MRFQVIFLGLLLFHTQIKPLENSNCDPILKWGLAFVGGCVIPTIAIGAGSLSLYLSSLYSQKFCNDIEIDPGETAPPMVIAQNNYRKNKREWIPLCCSSTVAVGTLMLLLVLFRSLGGEHCQ